MRVARLNDSFLKEVVWGRYQPNKATLYSTDRQIMSEEWTVMDPSKVTMEMVVTDIAVLAKKERVPTDYTLVGS